VGNPNWSFYNWTADGGRLQFLPSESDTTLQLADSWFYDADDGIRSLGELQDVYHETVGHNSLLMMDFSPTSEGVISLAHAARYAEFGAWRRGCYDSGSAGMVGIAEHARGSADAGSVQTLTFASPRVVDRVVTREDQSEGEAILAWQVDAQLSPPSVGGAGTWTKIANGTSMGNKWITLLPRNITVSSIRTVVTATAPGATARVRSTSAHLCPRSIPSSKCSVRQDWVADGVGNSTVSMTTPYIVAGCCCCCCCCKCCCCCPLT
jgi:alpha-L-fucosidase